MRRAMLWTLGPLAVCYLSAGLITKDWGTAAVIEVIAAVFNMLGYAEARRNSP